MLNTKMDSFFTLENFSKNIRVLLTRSGLPLGKEIENKLKELKKFDIVSCQNPSPDLINEDPFDIVIHLAGFDPPSFAETLYHTSILHQLLDLCLKHKAKFVLVLPTGSTALKEVAISLARQFHKLFGVGFELVEVGEKDGPTNAASEVIKKFVHHTHLQKLKKISTEIFPVAAKNKPARVKKMLVAAILTVIIPAGYFGWRLAGNKLLECGERALLSGQWDKAKKCAGGAVGLGASPQVAQLFVDLARVGESGQRLLSGRQEDTENFTSELSYAQERIAQVQLEVVDELLRSRLRNWRDLLSRLRLVAADAASLLGMSRSVNYLIILQDVYELRPTGGFIDGVGLLTVSGGKIENAQLLTPYTADGQMKGTVVSPEELQISTGETTWYLRDSNWNPKFPESARQAAWFIDKQLHQQVDVVVGLNTRTLAKILEVTGPVVIDGLDQQIDSKNLLSVGLFKASADPTSKSLYLSVFQAVLTKLQTLPSAKTGQLGAIVLEALENRQLMVSGVGGFLLPNITAAGWDGNLKPIVCQESVACVADTLYVVNSNVSINKANAEIDYKYVVDVSLVNQVADVSLNVTATNKSLANAWPTGDYKNYVRFYLPSSAQVKQVLVNNQPKEANSIKIQSTPEFVVIGLLVSTPANQTSTVGISFQRKLPETNRFNYILNIPNQPGIPTGHLGVIVNYPSTWLAQSTKPALVAAAGLLRYNAEVSHPFKVGIDFLRRD